MQRIANLRFDHHRVLLNMKRLLFNFTAGVSLLLLVVVGVLWSRSYWLTDQVDWRGDGGYRLVRSAQGHVLVQVTLADWTEYPGKFYGPRYERNMVFAPMNTLVFLSPELDDTNVNWEWAGFAWHGMQRARQDVQYAIAVVPFWCLALTMSVLPITWLTVRCKRFRKQVAKPDSEGTKSSSTMHRPQLSERLYGNNYQYSEYSRCV